MDYKPALWERITVFAAATLIVVIVLLLAVRNQAFSDPNLVAMVRIVLSLAIASLGATVPGFLNVNLKGPGLAIRAGGALALFVLTYFFTPTVLDPPPPPPRPSAGVNLYGGDLPPELDVPSDRKVGFTDASMRLGYVLTYRASLEKDVLRVTPHLKYLENQENGGPVLPIWIQGYFFTVPVLGIVVNNPTPAPIAVSAVVLDVKSREFKRDRWLVVSQPYWKSDAPNTTMIEFDDFGWDTFSDASINYDILPISDSQPGLDPTYDAIGGAEVLLAVPGLSWERDLPYKAAASRYANRFYGATVFFPLSEEAITRVRLRQCTALIFGRFTTSNSAGQVKTYLFATRLFLSYPGGPGRINPSFKYTVKIEAEGPPTIVSLPVAQEVGAGKQDYFLIAVFTEKPTDQLLRLRVKLSSGDVLDAGAVSLRTFFPKHYGNGGEPSLIDEAYVRAPSSKGSE